MITSTIFIYNYIIFSREKLKLAISFLILHILFKRELTYVIISFKFILSIGMSLKFDIPRILSTPLLLSHIQY